MNTIHRAIIAASAWLALSMAMLAQEGTIGAEHRYQFNLAEAPTAYSEKLMMESIISLDQEMRIDIDRDARVMKVLAYRPLDAQELVRLAAAHGVSLTPLRPRFEHANEVRTNP